MPALAIAPRNRAQRIPGSWDGYFFLPTLRFACIVTALGGELLSPWIAADP
jgi:hypothetical protein